VADALKKEPGFQVELVDGQKGEFTVLVDGREVVRKKGDSLPDVQEVLSAVRQSQSVGAAG
jgi:hypothetical protein